MNARLQSLVAALAIAGCSKGVHQSSEFGSLDLPPSHELSTYLEGIKKGDELTEAVMRLEVRDTRSGDLVFEEIYEIDDEGHVFMSATEDLFEHDPEARTLTIKLSDPPKTIKLD
jgi:hypothetical protein